jgi:prophage regulatory protein
MNNNFFLKLPAIISMSGKSRSSIYNAIKIGAFPAPVKIGPRAVAWTSASIAQWQADCVAASKAGGAA